MQMKKSEVLDRWTILLMKSRLEANAATELKIFNKEVQFIVTEAAEKGKVFEFLSAAVALMEANSRVWENEAALRKEFPKDKSAQGRKLTDKEKARRGDIIREYNGQRVRAKQEIDRLFGEIPDIKVEHASG